MAELNKITFSDDLKNRISTDADFSHFVFRCFWSFLSKDWLDPNSAIFEYFTYGKEENTTIRVWASPEDKDKKRMMTIEFAEKPTYEDIPEEKGEDQVDGGSVDSSV